MNVLISETFIDRGIKFGTQVSVYSTHITVILASYQL